MMLMTEFGRMTMGTRSAGITYGEFGYFVRLVIAACYSEVSELTV